MNCVITGCALIGEAGLWVPGDLFDGGEVFVFNGNFNRQEDGPSWIDQELSYTKWLAPLNYWERRGVFVIPKDQANLNAAALDYIGETS